MPKLFRFTCAILALLSITNSKAESQIQEPKPAEPIASPVLRAPTPPKAHVTIRKKAPKDPEAEPSGIGLHLGLNRSNVSYSTGASTGLNFFTAGVFADLSIGARFFLSPEISYAKAGYLTLSAKTSWTVIDVPVLVKYHILDGFIRPFVELGPTFRYYVSGTMAISGSTAKADVMEGTNRIGFILTVGTGVEIRPTPTIGTILSFRYLYGLTNVLKSTGATSKSRDMELLAGMKFSW